MKLIILLILISTSSCSSLNKSVNGKDSKVGLIENIKEYLHKQGREIL